MKRRTIITIALPVAALIVGLTLCLCYELDNRSFSVTSTGPLDIHLWGIRPDAGDAIYDPNGKKDQGYSRTGRRAADCLEREFPAF